MNRDLIRSLEQLLGNDGVLSTREDLLLYEYDGSVEVARPECVVFPRSTEDVVRIVALSNRHEVPLVGRGAGTGLSGGALARHGGILVVFSRMNQILGIDIENRRAVVQPGVVNLDLTRAVEHAGLHYAPDPSSQKACTIGGNVAENAGGPHTLAYGVTTNHVLGLKLVLPTGEEVQIGSSPLDATGYDLAGLFVGSEGTLALVTEITVKLTPLPETIKTLLAVFDSLDDATETVVDITSRGITPAACEMMDGWTLRAVEAYVHAGFPLDSAAVLLLEVDGLREAVEEQSESVAEVCRLHHAREVRVARDAQERDLLWKGRKNAFGAIGRICPTYYVQDGVIPRTKLPATLRRITEIGRKNGFEIGNIFHAGDGNLHPIILFDARNEAEFKRVVTTAGEIIQFCIEMGGAITGEHGVGMEKDHLMPLSFSAVELDLMRGVRDAFNPKGLLNPGKIFPDEQRMRRDTRSTLAACGNDGPMSASAKISETRFADIVGPDYVALDPEILSSFEIDGVTPAAVARPGSAQEVADLVRLAAAENLAVIATGSRSKLGIGMPPARYDVAIDMTRLDAIVAYDPGDLTLAVKAGIPLHKLASMLEEQRQFLPLGVPFFDRTTVGGTIATGVDTPLRQLFGTARDYLLGMEFVTGEGNLTKSGGRVVKNVTGYDLHKLMIGALGTLGIITKINFRTFPLPAASRGFVATFVTAEAALGFRHRIARSALAPSTIEILSPGVAELFYSDAASRIEPAALRPDLLSNAKWTLTSGYAGSDRVLRVTKRICVEWRKKPVRPISWCSRTISRLRGAGCGNLFRLRSHLHRRRRS